jgi:hypothetical protein
VSHIDASDMSPAWATRAYLSDSAFVAVGQPQCERRQVGDWGESTLADVRPQPSPEIASPEPLMTARQVAVYLQTSPRRVVDLWKAGQLVGFWLNPSGRRDLRFRRTDVDWFLDERRCPTGWSAG